jgi:molybdopterin synthase catalytic subunit
MLWCQLALSLHFFRRSLEAEMVEPRVQIQTGDFDVGREVARLGSCCEQVGAVVNFVGTVRGGGEGGVHAMALEHYPGMTEKAIEAILDNAQARFGITAARVIHRVGHLLAGEQIVWVGVAAAHRAQAFLACEFVMDFLKIQAPFWKKEFGAQGAKWVCAQEGDALAQARWDLKMQGLSFAHEAV